MVVTFCPECYTDDLLEEYPFARYVKIYTVDYYDLPIGAIGATNRKNKVYIRRDLPFNEFRNTKFHEFEHFLHDPLTPEFIIEYEARKKLVKKELEKKLSYIV